MTPPKARQRVLVERTQVDACDRHRPAVGTFEARHHHQERRFAGAGRPHQANGLAAAYMQVNVFKDMNAGRPVPERKIDTGKRNSRRRLRVIRHGTSLFATPLIWE